MAEPGSPSHVEVEKVKEGSGRSKESKRRDYDGLKPRAERVQQAGSSLESTTSPAVEAES